MPNLISDNCHRWGIEYARFTADGMDYVVINRSPNYHQETMVIVPAHSVVEFPVSRAETELAYEIVSVLRKARMVGISANDILDNVADIWNREIVDTSKLLKDNVGLGSLA